MMVIVIVVIVIVIWYSVKQHIKDLQVFAQLVTLSKSDLKFQFIFMAYVCITEISNKDLKTVPWMLDT